MSLQSDIADYQENELRELHELARFFKSLSFASAIEYAASGVSPHKKIHLHQRRIGVKRLRKSTAILKKHIPVIRKAKSFADLFVITETIRLYMKGLGDLWSYDTALRMAFNRGKTFYPRAVYVQEGSMKSVKRIFSNILIKGRVLPMKLFPKEMRVLKPFEAENFLTVWEKRSYP
jgi:hypothetical protein